VPILISEAYKTQNDIITSVLKKITFILQLDAAWQNEFRFDLLAIKFAFYVPQYLKQREKGWAKFVFQQFQRNTSNQNAPVWISSSFATEQRVAFCRRQKHFHKNRHNALKNVFYGSA